MLSNYGIGGNEVVVSARPVSARKQMVGASITVISAAKTVFRGKVIAGDDAKPLPGALVQVAGTQLQALTNANGDFEIRMDSLMNYGVLKASSIGFKQIEVRAYANEAFNLVLSPDHQELNEVVVVGFGAAKKKTDISQALASRIAGIAIHDKSGNVGVANSLSGAFMPVGGWDKFREYLKKKNRFSDEAKTGKSVVLSFNVDKKGKPENIKVLMGIAEKYDQEAIRLLSKGPKWSLVKEAADQLFVNIDF